MKRSALADLKVVLDQLIGNDNVLSNNILFIDFTGSHEKAQLLSQMWYWSGKTKDKHGWFFKTYQEWFDEIRVPEHSVRRFVDAFKKAGFVATCFKKVAGRPVVHYRLDKDVLIQKLVTFCEGNNLLGSHSVILEDDNLQPTKEPDNLQPSIYTEITSRDLQTENSNVVFDENDPAYLVTVVSIESAQKEQDMPPPPAAKIIDYLNAKTGRKYRAKTTSTAKAINARLEDGYTVADFFAVIDNRVAAWLHKPDMAEYLRPETLFRPAHFESYLNAGINPAKANTNEALKDCPLPDDIAPRYEAYFNHALQTYPALLESATKVFSHCDYLDYWNNTSTPGLPFSLTASDKRRVMLAVHEQLNANKYLREKYNSTFAAYLVAVRQSMKQETIKL